MEEVFGDDLFYTVDVDQAVPDNLPIDHDDRPLLTLVEAGRLKSLLRS